MPAPKLGDNCFCEKERRGGTLHPMATDCFEDCEFDCRAPKLCITVEDTKRALIHHRDHVYHE